MELLLNILWLALTLPAVWMWVRKPVCASQPQRFGHYRPFLLLGCALIVLFPVISATDDLNAIRPEIEESGPATRQLKHSVSSRSAVWIYGSTLFQHMSITPHPGNQPCELVSLASSAWPEVALIRQQLSRGPPAGILS